MKRKEEGEWIDVFSHRLDFDRFGCLTLLHPGMGLLKEFGKSLAVTPTLHLHHPNPSAKIQKHDKAEFRSRYPGVKREAEKYGWQVDSQLKGRRW